MPSDDQTSTHSRQLRLKARPQGEVRDSDFELIASPIPELDESQFLVKITHISIDPAMRGWMSEARSYLPPVQLGDVMRALAVGRVVASRHTDYSAGDWVHGAFGIQEHAVSNGNSVYKIDVTEPLTPQSYLGVIGLTGLTAYFGLLHIGQLNEGDRVLVSGAAGAVGTAVGQIAKIKSCNVVGIAGGEAKCRMLVDELGFDAAVDYKRADLHEQLRSATAERVDVFFDNVGGEILDEGLGRLRRGARAVICGAISDYNRTDRPGGPANYMELLVNRASMVGFVASDFAKEWPAAIAVLAEWVRSGQLRSVEDTVAGDIETFPTIFGRLFTGQNIGKLVLELPS